MIKVILKDDRDFLIEMSGEIQQMKRKTDQK
jgi:hypothetical protein